MNLCHFKNRSVLLGKVAQDFPNDTQHVLGGRYQQIKAQPLFHQDIVFGECISGTKVIWNHYQLILVEKPSVKYLPGNMI